MVGIQSETRLKAWGNSIGVVIPKEMLQHENLSVNDEVEIIIKKKANPLREAFGRLKGVKARLNKTTDELLKEIDEELDPAD